MRAIALSLVILAFSKDAFDDSSGALAPAKSAAMLCLCFADGVLILLGL